MDAIALHLELRNALALADELSRHQHARGQQAFAAQLSAVRTTLAELERDAGRSHSMVHIPAPDQIARLNRSLGTIRDQADAIPVELRPRIVMLMDALERIAFAESRPATPVPAKKLFGALPLARVIPQDVHSVGDYLVAATYFGSALVARTRRGRAMGLLLGCAVGGVSLATDYRLSLVKLLPIELHELADHASGLKAAAAPMVLGYAKKDPIAAAIQIVAGIGTIALSLFTDYRADKGIALARRSRGGPRPKRDLLPKNVKNRVPEVQRPLEGFAGPSYIPAVDV